MHSGLEEFVSTDETGQIIIDLPSGPTPISDTAKQIFSLMAKDNRAFYRGGRVHEVAADSDGRLRLDVLLPEALRSRIEKLGVTMAYIKNQKGEYNQTKKRPTYEDCKALLATTEARERLRPIANVYASPVLVLDQGEPVTLAKGYHDIAGGAFVCDGETVPELDRNWTRWRRPGSSLTCWWTSVMSASPIGREIYPQSFPRPSALVGSSADTCLSTPTRPIKARPARAITSK